MSDPNYPAYPTTPLSDIFPGLTIRQQFVMAAMQGLCANPKMDNALDIASEAVTTADAALAEEARTRSTA